MKKLLTAVFGIVMLSVVATSSAFAAFDFGQLGSGDIYRVRNLSDNQTDFVKTAQADPCETVQFKVRVHNAGPKTLTNVTVKATLPSGSSTTHTSTVTVTADNNRDDAAATGSASVVVSKAAKISYVAGSTELLDTNGNKISTLADTLFTSGVNIGDVAVSLNQMRFVQFKAKLNCEMPKDNCPIPGKEHLPKDSPDCKETPVTPENPEMPTELPETGAADTILTVIGLGAVTASAVYAIKSRKNLLG